jgi:hypothetical protein
MPVTMTVNPSGKNGRCFRQRALLLVCPHKLPGGALPFWRPGATVSVLLGAGEHAGLVRIEPGPGHTLLKVIGRGKAGNLSATLALHGLPFMPAAGMKSTALDYDFSDGWLEVTLPAWPRPAAAVAPSAATPGKPAMPFRGVAAREGLPASIGRPSRPAAL